MEIKTARYIKNYQIEITFTDGLKRVIDLGPFLKKSTHYLIRKYLDVQLFKQFRVETGTICWGDNDFDLNPVNIYQGKYDVKTTAPKSTQNHS